ncbi:hypothetical protein VTN96DRAFT_6461 [Rasamsonia emersonii]|uniref:Ribosomal protein s17 n=1 Tax=Rasamsonia emersonii (strain ATCC 16479 / CBS 393.64 / IMI 116815) TaxID=1408163 RepID=A0A0F4Z0C2_RASE3|nr:hypothetical protein T310_2438 [Rasamsonia emersonii CBS 393.64]KKA23541.1 hypothetical protein T310_2438 [Rasamsonia emersonii CBS 393.64]
MYVKKLLFALALSATVLDGALAAGRNGNNGNNKNGNNGNTNTGNNGNTGNNANNANNGNTNTNTGNTGNTGNSNSDLALNPNLVQTGSQNNGLSGTGAEAGESPSATDNANFINFCQGKTLTNGQQIKGGSCNGIVMGDIPSTENMISTVILNPQTGQDLPANQDFNVTLQVNGLQAGSFTNANTTYYAAPQALNSKGQIIGHTHVTIQNIGSLNPSTPPDPTTFAFFKGINDAGDGNGGLSAAVTGGLPAGVYRVCTMTSASNHQPVLMPIAQRGAQDDCTKFTVGQGQSNNNNNNANSGTSSNSASSAAASTSAQASSGNGGNNSKSGNNSNSSGNGNTSKQNGNNGNSGNRNGGKNGGRGRFVTRQFVA